MRAVVDTNILIRALIKPRGTVGPIITRLRNGDYTLVYSTPLLTRFPVKEFRKTRTSKAKRPVNSPINEWAY